MERDEIENQLQLARDQVQALKGQLEDVGDRTDDIRDQQQALMRSALPKTHTVDPTVSIYESDEENINVVPKEERSALRTPKFNQAKKPTASATHESDRQTLTKNTSGKPPEFFGGITGLYNHIVPIVAKALLGQALMTRSTVSTSAS